MGATKQAMLDELDKVNRDRRAAMKLMEQMIFELKYIMGRIDSYPTSLMLRDAVVSIAGAMDELERDM